jgi:glycosyltransferase involved in cell wall biosynthesis
VIPAKQVPAWKTATLPYVDHAECFLDVLVSTGIGRLHLIDTASAICAGGRSVRLITGWAPSPGHRVMVNGIGRLLGQKRLFERLNDRRRLVTLEGCPLSQCPVAEGAMTLAAKFGFHDNDKINERLWALFGWESRRHIRNARVFHVRAGAGGGGAIDLARRQGMKVVVDHSIGHPAVIWKNLRGNGADGPEADGFGPTSLFWKRVMNDCAAADAVLVNSDYVRRTMVEQGYDGARIHVAYLGIGTEWLGEKVEHRDLEKQSIRALFVGHFAKRKGSHILIKAARKLRENGVFVEFHIAGDAHSGRTEAIANGVESMFHFHGLLGRDELKHRLMVSDIFVFPTLAEGCAKAAMEALAVGLPVITTRECGLPEAATDCVQFVPLGDPDELANAIEELGSNREKRARFGAKGAKLVRQSFGPRHFAKAVDTFYQELLGADASAAVIEQPA